MKSFLLLSLLIACVACKPASQIDRLVIAAESGKLAIAEADGTLLWEHPITQVHDLQLLENGNLLVNNTWTKVMELDLAGNTVWEYDSSKTEGYNGQKIEIHAFQRLANGNTMIAESGISRIVEVDSQGKLVSQIPLQVRTPHAHTDTRLVRKLENGDYLVSHEGEQRVARYTSSGKVVWNFDVPLFGKEPAKGHGPEAYGAKTFSAIVLKNGNHLISTGNGHGVLEVTPDKDIVWRLSQNDIPGVTLAWVTTLQELSNGNFVLGNCHAGPDNPQIIEINRAKELVWSWKNVTDFQKNALSNSLVVEGEQARSLKSRLKAL
ncbi:MAG: PQQ-binding-like beta-propeller repeat protein [Verrucomicrobia bacterium]|nr:PQQ-binding-like beta-propeller repeat protein [Verrucomicrobiota bacterium]MDA1069760.1 PQQ-binding-like beta-propeller repeat protein [Verrucomicrobiota bacterium]